MENKPIFYHHKGCGMCNVVEMMLKRNNIEYESIEDIDIMIERGITGTPTLDVDGTLYVKKECLDWIKGR